MRTVSLLAGLGVVGVLSSGLLSCSGGNVASKLAEAPAFEPPGGGTKCAVTANHAAPLIVEWPDADRGRLESLAKKHVVAVRYAGCHMQVLDQCSVPGKYGYSALTRKKTHVKMRDADDLYANIPVHAAQFEATLRKAGELNVAMTIVGRYEADEAVGVKPEALHGDCAGATHVVSAMTVGAFEFFAGADATVGGGASVGNAGVGAKSAAQRELLNEDGDKASCEKSTSEDRKAPEGCGALLRVEVVPLGEAKRAEVVCPEGTKWDGAQCVRMQVVTQIQCPAGTRLEGQGCVANVSTNCAAGMHFVTGIGCVADVVAGSSAQPVAAASDTGGDTISAAGLVWQKQPAVQRMNWADAKAYCASRGGRWRLPSKEELVALYNSGSVDKSDWYWSSSPLAWSPSGAWGVYFNDGLTFGGDVTGTSSVRCVR